MPISHAEIWTIFFKTNNFKSIYVAALHNYMTWVIATSDFKKAFWKRLKISQLKWDSNTTMDIYSLEAFWKKGNRNQVRTFPNKQLNLT